MRVRAVISDICVSMSFCVVPPPSWFHERQPIGGSRARPLSLCRVRV
jgi:hypothetical protein